MKAFIVLAAALAPLALQAEPLDYDYIYLSDHDADSGAVDDGEAFGGFWTFAETLHVFGSYDDTGAYGGAGENPAWDYDTRALRVGVGGHYRIGERTMIAPAIAVLRAEMDVMAPAWTAPREFSDTGYGLQLDLRHALTNRFELAAGARYTDVLDNDSSELVGGIVFHATDWLALGALYHDREGEGATEMTVRWYF